MKKVIILTLLAFLALPAMSITTTQAWDTLNQYGFDPTVLKLGQSVTAPTKEELQMKISEGFVSVGNTVGNFLAHQGSVEFFDSKYDHGLYGNNITSVAVLSDYHNTKLHIAAVGVNKTQTWRWKVYANNSAAYDNYSSGVVSHFKVHSGNRLFLTNDNIIDNLGSEIGELIIGGSEDLKSGLLTLGYQTVASTIGKNAHDVCKVNTVSTVAACNSIGDKFVSISSKIENIGLQDSTAMDYNAGLEIISDLSDVLVTFDGMTFGDLFTVTP